MRGPRVWETPIVCRSFLALICALAWCDPLLARDLTEADVIRLARRSDPEVWVARQEALLSAANEVEADLYPNPQLAWEREHLPGGALSESEDVVSLSVPIDVSGRRSARRELARSETTLAQALAAQTQSEAVVRALLTYYEAVAARHRTQILRRMLERLEEAARVLGRRFEEGTVSGYARTRLELEVEFVQSELRASESRAQVLERELGLLLGIENSVRLSDNLNTKSVADASVPTRTKPSIRLMETSAKHAGAAQNGAGSAWVPTFSVTGGLKVATSDETRYGYVAGVALSIPLFSRGQDVQGRAQAQQRLAEARVVAHKRTAQMQVARAGAEQAMAQQELQRFDQGTAERVERLVRAAESGYREGQRSILELLDAQKAQASVEQRRLDLALAAKRAEITLRAARGEFE